MRLELERSGARHDSPPRFMTWLLLCLLAASLAAGPGLAAEGLSDLDRRRLRVRVDALRDELHYSRESVDVEAVVRAVDAQLEAGASRKDVRLIAVRALLREMQSFAPRGATHGPRVKYRYPFDPSIPRLVTQGVDGDYSHQGEHAFDFALPVGARVLAARPGEVARVVDGFRGRQPRELDWKVNTVYILHRDGTYAVYTHLHPGIPVEEGQRVRAGELIAHSGDTGWTTGPHLHFEVRAKDASDEASSIPIRFFDGTPAGRVPEKLDLILGRRPATVDLHVSADGVRAEPGSEIPVAMGDRSRLRVELVGSDGRTIDITTHEKLRFFAASPWFLQVSPLGWVKFGRDPENYPGWLSELNNGIVTVIFEDLDSGRLGYADVSYRLDLEPESDDGRASNLADSSPQQP